MHKVGEPRAALADARHCFLCGDRECTTARGEAKAVCLEGPPTGFCTEGVLAVYPS